MYSISDKTYGKKEMSIYLLYQCTSFKADLCDYVLLPYGFIYYQQYTWYTNFSSFGECWAAISTRQSWNIKPQSAIK